MNYGIYTKSKQNILEMEKSHNIRRQILFSNFEYINLASGRETID
jgi:hypothetical protein